MATAPAVDALTALGVGDELVASVLYARGLRNADDVERFVSPERFPEDSPFDLPGMHEAVARISWAIRRGQRIVIHGDYDVDGLSATAVMIEGLAALGNQPQAYVPNRLESGYGLDMKAVRELAASADVLVTVDCGIRSLEEVAEARRLGMTVIVTDHHLPGEELPAADAIVSSRQVGGACFEELTGAGIAHQLVHALGAVRSRFGDTEGAPDPFDDLTALGTIADVAPLIGANRRLARAGLALLRRRPRPGLLALMRSARIDQAALSARDISHGLAPRLNAAGRMGSSLPALQLLMTRDSRRAAQLASQLERANSQRKGHVEQCLALARAELAALPPGQACVFSASATYPRGVLGLVASKLADQSGLPAVVVALEDGLAHGSVRCAPPVNASEALDACHDVLIRHGGHAAAAGFVCATARLPELRARLCGLASDLLAGQDARPPLSVVAQAPLPGETDAIWDWLPRLEPTGRGNEQPIFVTRDVMLQDALSCGEQSQHLKLVLSGGGRYVRAMAFQVGERGRSLPQQLDIAYRLDENTYRGVTERRLIVLDWQQAGA